jgi:NAD(P)-dependent dehydrogenase (short-subunit alcohol dehydrogenase family)
VKSALVTGASSGIGAACAQRLARNGWRVFAGVRKQGDAPPGTEELILDVTKDAHIRAAAEAVGGELDAVVNNAGIALAAPLESVPIDELRNQLEVNVIGQVAVTQALLPALRRARGRIVLIGSIAGKSAMPFLGPYAASKHALEAIADSLRLELSPFGIRVVLIEPGSILTPIWTRSAARADELLERMDGEVNALYGERIAAFRKIALRRGAAGAPADAVAEVVEKALTAGRPRTRYLVGRDAKLRAGFEKLPDKLRDRLYERALLRG